MIAPVAAATSGGVQLLNARAARYYAKRGLLVHPLRPGEKLPLLQRWQHRATTDPVVIDVWFAKWPTAGVAIATGAASGIVVLDIDPRHGGNESLDELVAEHGEMPETWTAHTANAGGHLYFRHPGRPTRNRVALWPGIDLRGDNGYVAAPPTALDASRRYVWQSESGPHEIALASPPHWLLSSIEQRTGTVEPRPIDEWSALVRNGVARGARNATVARLAGYLLRRKPAARAVLEIMRAWNQSRCRPPLSDEEIARTVDSIARREGGRRMEARCRPPG